MKARAAAAGLTLAAAGGCIDYRLVEPSPVGAGLGITVFILHDDSARYELRGFFQHGTGPSGRRPALRDSTLVVDGVRLAPSRVTSDGLLMWEWRETRAADDPRSALALRGPVPDEGAALEVMVPLVARAGPRDVPLPPGEDVRLGVARAAWAPGLDVRDFGWTLSVRATCASDVLDPPLVSISSRALLPAEVRLARTLLPDTLSAAVAACLTTGETILVDRPAYRAGVTAAARLEWRLVP